MAEQYVVLADVVESRDVADRDSLRETLTETLAYVNRTHADSIDTAFERIKGIDEFGGVLAELPPLYDIIADILNGIHPVRVRFGVAGGRIDGSERANSVRDMDGPAFHRADRLLSEVEADDLYAAIDAGNEADRLVSNNVNLLLMYREHLTDRQIETVRAYERHGTQSAAADALGVRQQSVSKTLDRAGYQRTNHLRVQLRETLGVLYD